MRFDKKSKVFERLLQLVGVEATRKILIEYGGTSVYIPKFQIFLGYRRNLRIAEEYESGEYSQAQLAEKWGLSQSQIQRIIKKIERDKDESARSNNGRLTLP